MIAAALLAAACGSSTSSRTVPAASAGGTTSASSTSSASGSSGYGVPSQSSASSSVKLVAKHSKLGMVLAAGPKKLTVYLFQGDSGTASHCSGACAKAWPPVTVSGQPGGSPPVQSSLIGTTNRPDGTKQLTYKGHPLYYFIKDKDDGDTYGEGVKAFGANWYALGPTGAKIDKS